MIEDHSYNKSIEISIGKEYICVDSYNHDAEMVYIFDEELPKDKQYHYYLLIAKQTSKRIKFTNILK